MTHTKNNIPIYATEQIINEETASIQKILNKKEFKQPISTDFVELTNAKKNNWGSTEGLDKPLCERYLFVRENKRIWLDIPHELMEKLELPIGKSFPWPLYLKLELLVEKEEIEGAITIENEEEIFIDKPVSEKNAKEELVKRLEELKILREEKEELQEKNEEYKKFRLLSLLREKGLSTKLERIEFKVWYKDIIISRLKKERKRKDKKITNLEKELEREREEKNNLQIELRKERNWFEGFTSSDSAKVYWSFSWDDENDFIHYFQFSPRTPSITNQIINIQLNNSNSNRKLTCGKLPKESIDLFGESELAAKEFKKKLRTIRENYLKEQ